ncbi:MAG: hypothetical protein U0Q16_11595 [Bryobacteraceae bacterium]
MVDLALYHDSPSCSDIAAKIEKEDLLARVKVLDARAERKGLDSLDPEKNELIGLGMEINSGRVTKNSYGVLNLAWKAERDGDWGTRVAAEVEEIRQRIRSTHGAKLRFIVWAGMGGSAEDKAMYDAVGLLRGGPRLFVLDSTDPAKLKAILAEIRKKSRTLEAGLKATLVVGMAMGMTSYEPVVNLEKLYSLFERHGIDSRPNFIYMTLPGSLLDQFASARGYRRVELQLDNGNSTAGRHSGPLTRGSLYPLAFAAQDLDAWIAGAFLSKEDVSTALRLAAFFEAQGRTGRDQVTLVLPPSWDGAAIWTKQDFEESLGKSEATGIKIFTGEKAQLANYLSPKDPAQRRVFLAVLRHGENGEHRKKVDRLKRSGYPVAVLRFGAGEPLSAYMQFIHYVVFGLGYLRKMNFVTQPSVELYKAITNKLHGEAGKVGGIGETAAWKRFADPKSVIRYRGGVALHFAFCDPPEATSAPAAFAELAARARAAGAHYAELSFFGDLRYSERGKAVRRVLDRIAEKSFRAKCKMPVDAYEGPAMNHSYHEMIIGHGKAFSTVLLAEDLESIPEAGYTADYHRAQFLATQMALAERGRPVVAITLRDRKTASLAALEEFFRQAALALKPGKR